jgi:hypothetical protein
MGRDNRQRMDQDSERSVVRCQRRRLCGRRHTEGADCRADETGIETDASQHVRVESGCPRLAKPPGQYFEDQASSVVNHLCPILDISIGRNRYAVL